MNNSTKKKKNSNNDKNNKTMPPPPSRTPQAQSFLRKYDKFTAVMVVMRVECTGRSITCPITGKTQNWKMLKNKGGKKIDERETTQR